MLSQSAVSGTVARLAVDVRRFPWMRRLAIDYALDYARLADFFNGHPGDPLAWREAITRAQDHRRDREAITTVLEAQQERRRAPLDTRAAAARPRDPRTVAIVTGQQAGLFGGPFFTLLKAITAIRLAERVRAEHQVDAVAVFWIDAEDHDWDEVKTCGVLDADLQFQDVALGQPAGAHEMPVARVQLDGSVVAAIDALASTLPATEHTALLLDTLRQSYSEGRGMADAFGRWLESVLGPHGLIVFDASDAAAKPLAADVFAREIARGGDTARLAADAGAALEARGYHAQAAPPAGSLALFHLNAGRDPIRLDGPGTVRIGERQMSSAELLDEVRRSPARFSPNVLLRPIVQDTLFPTVCYVAGPNELAYLAQLRKVYQAFETPMPLMQPRPSATVLDSNSMRFLTRHDFPFEALQAQNEAALNDLLESQLPPAVDASFQDAQRTIEAQMIALAAAAPQIDATLEGAVRSTLARMQDDLKKLHGKIIQAAKRKDETLRRQFHHARAQAFPGGKPQERAVGFVYFLNKFGPALVDRLSDEVPLDMGTHWVVTV